MDAIFKTSWKTQINIMWIGQAILMAMMAMSLPYWPLYITQLGGFSPLEIRYWSAAIYLAPFISATFSSPFWGRMGDKRGYKPMVMRACLGLLITQTCILLVSNVFLIFVIGWYHCYLRRLSGNFQQLIHNLFAGDDYVFLFTRKYSSH